MRYSPKIIVDSETINFNDYSTKIVPKWELDVIIHTSVLSGKKTRVNRTDEGYGRFSCEIIVVNVENTKFEAIAVNDVIDFYLYSNDDVHFDCIVKDVLPFFSGGKYKMYQNVKITLLSRDYVMNPHKCTDPVFDPEGYEFPYGGSAEVTITSATPGSTIYYTTDGSDPDDNDTEYTTPITITTTTTVKAIIYKTGMRTSGISSETYVRGVPE